MNAREIGSLLAPFPGRLAYALKLAVIATLSIFIFFRYQAPEASMGVFMVFFMNKPDRTTSIILSVVFVTLVVLVITAVIGLSSFMLDHPAWRMAMIGLLTFAMVFLGQASKLGSLGMMLAMLTVYIWDLVSQSPSAELVTRAMLYALLFVFIPAAVTVAWNLAFGPAPAQVAAWTIAGRLQAAAQWLRDLSPGARERLLARLNEGAGAVPAGLGLQAKEKTWPAEDVAALRRADGSSFYALSLVAAMERDRALLPSAAGRASLADTFDEMAQVLNSGRYPVSACWRPDEGDAAAETARRLSAQALMSVTLRDFARAPAESAPQPAQAAPRQAQAAAESKKASGGGFFAPGAFVDPAYLRDAFKVSAAAMFCYFLYNALDWQGIHTCMITIFMVSLTTSAESVEKLLLRVVGAVIGGALGIGSIVFLIPLMTSGGEMLALVFLVALAGGWLFAGGPRVSYAGVQMAFAFAIGALHSSAGPSYDMVAIRDRLIGILIGDAVAFVVAAYFWPTSLHERANKGLKAAIGAFAGLAARASPAQAGAQAAAAWSSLAAARVDLDLSDYEPLSIRPDPEWIAARREAARSLGDLYAPLLLAAQEDPVLAGRVGARLRGVLAGESGEAGAQDGSQALPADLARAAARIEYPFRGGGGSRERGAYVEA